jgi:hypothetical protein
VDKEKAASLKQMEMRDKRKKRKELHRTSNSIPLPIGPKLPWIHDIPFFFFPAISIVSLAHAGKAQPPWLFLELIEHLCCCNKWRYGSAIGDS